MAEVRRLPDDGSIWGNIWSSFTVGDKAEVLTTMEGVPSGKVKVVTWTDITVHGHPAFIVAKGVIDINDLNPMYMTDILGTISNTDEELAVDAIICYPMDEIGLEAEAYDNREDSRTAFISTMLDFS
ncbi:hypothetical protein [Bacillus phage phiAGATE]|uniref:Uncharacterized protein n=1 Tax=Bacillus phage phiAGATE TaxID=1204533 RepID=L0LC48_9CAUD|nr:hypothetical protein G380_gp006 [Bacillus phage phiAGATE]YP_008855205.1 hypothetical protein G380_gp167 [Bacillus phage phiAGATE]AGB62656.1 hypothetical protein [Bacillus phage phiAGATE]AHB12553.1 hypothetical protein [Bacillus phage phiAGATE]